MQNIFNSEEVAEIIDKELTSYFSKKIDEAGIIHENAAQLWQVMQQVTMAGGKRIRPKLFLFGCLAYNEQAAIEDYASSAISWEILHSSLLMHDDIIDHATVRHGTDNVTGTYQKIYANSSNLDSLGLNDFANSTALLAGDLLVTAHVNIVANSNLTIDQKSILNEHINKAIFEAGAGQLLDCQAPTLPIGAVDPNITMRNKTSSYTTIHPLLAGARIGNPDNSDLEKLARIGELMGRVFQLRDDILGSFGNEEVTGKSNTSDIYDGERTMLFIETYNRVDKDSKSLLSKLDGVYKPSPEEVGQIKSLMRSSGAMDAIEQEIASDHSQTCSLVEDLSISQNYKQRLIQLASKLKDRDH